MVSPLAAELRKHVVRLIAAVLVLDTAAIGLYYGLHISRTVPRVQLMFTGVWTALTLVVVLVSLGRIRSARVRSRSGRY